MNLTMGLCPQLRAPDRCRVVEQRITYAPLVSHADDDHRPAWGALGKVGIGSGGFL